MELASNQWIKLLFAVSIYRLWRIKKPFFDFVLQKVVDLELWLCGIEAWYPSLAYSADRDGAKQVEWNEIPKVQRFTFGSKFLFFREKLHPLVNNGNPEIQQAQLREFVSSMHICIACLFDWMEWNGMEWKESTDDRMEWTEHLTDRTGPDRLFMMLGYFADLHTQTGLCVLPLWSVQYFALKKKKDI